MKIIKQFKGEDNWEEVSLEDTLEKLECVYSKDTIVPMLKEGVVLQTPFSFFKALTKEEL